MRLSEAGERRVVGRIVRLLGRFPRGVGPGDDAAAIPWGRDYLVATTDVVNEGVHFPPGTPWDLVGWYAAGASLSDLAAKGARPLGLLLAVSVPGRFEERVVYDIMRGAERCARAHGTRVWGGDTKEAARASVAGTAFGVCRRGLFVPRGGARAGDLVGVTGRLGTAALAFRRWSSRHDRKALRGALRIEARLAAGRALAGHVRAMTDTSDGLATALRLIGEASRSAFEVAWDALPLAPGLEAAFGRRVAAAALGFGGEYELAFTCAAAKRGAVERALGRAGSRVSWVGRAVRGEPGLVWLSRGARRREVSRLGWEQFRPRVVQ